MRKGIVVILAVAIIGVLGIYGKGHSNNTQASAGTNKTSILGASTATNTQSQTPATSSGSSSSSSYKDGTYTGASEETVYGTVQVAAVVSGGKITNINFLQMPDRDGHSQEVTSFSEPLLKQITLQKQSAHIDFVSGATQTSEGYQQSLQSALDQAA